MSYIPNILTLLRIAVCPFMVILLSAQNYAAALLLFLSACMTDGLDGYIAKRYNCVSEFGSFIDPLADKLLVISTCIMLTILQDIPLYLLVVVASRDLLIVGFILVLSVLGKQLFMRPLPISKLNSFVQSVLLLTVLLKGATQWPLALLIELLIAGVIVTTMVSGVQYARRWRSYRKYQRAS